MTEFLTVMTHTFFCKNRCCWCLTRTHTAIHPPVITSTSTSGDPYLSNVISYFSKSCCTSGDPYHNIGCFFNIVSKNVWHYGTEGVCSKEWHLTSLNFVLDSLLLFTFVLCWLISIFPRIAHILLSCFEFSWLVMLFGSCIVSDFLF